uniref:Uncharacterized protein n=1 Tax=Panagrolaimus sp. ES5 TaxID=591445 RepID=A0AC34FB21_9BILA
MMVTNYDNFRQTCQPQIFSFSKTIMKYVLLNPESPETYLKTIKSCKLLFLKNPILIIPILRYTKFDGWKYCCTNEMETFYNGLQNIDLDKIQSKIWITEILRVFPDSSKTIASKIVPKIYRCDAKMLQLENQNISFQDFQFLSAFVDNEINFHEVTVEKEDGNVVLIDELCQNLSDVVIFI